MKIAAIVLLMIGVSTTQSTPRDATAVYVENHCVAVLTEAHIEKHPTIGWGNTPEIDGEGNEIVHVPEQTLKIRCK